MLNEPTKKNLAKLCAVPSEVREYANGEATKAGHFNPVDASTPPPEAFHSAMFLALNDPKFRISSALRPWFATPPGVLMLPTVATIDVTEPIQAIRALWMNLVFLRLRCWYLQLPDVDRTSNAIAENARDVAENWKKVCSSG